MATKPMDWSEFARTPEFNKLSVRQKLWFRSYVESGSDRLFATRCAYGTAGGESTRVFGYEVIRHPAIIAAMNRYFNLSLRDIFLRELQADIKASKPGSMARAELQAVKAKVLAGGKLPKSTKRRKSS
jgi:hypothetical protein